MRILVVEDDLPLRKVITELFEEESYQVDGTDSGDDGLFLAEQGIYDLLVFDIMLPGMSGLAIVRKLRLQAMATPILFLTAKDSVEDRVQGLDVGADDYLVKPFAVSELLARVRALLRRQGAIGAEGEISYCGISIKPKLHDAFVAGMPMQLTIKEYELMEYLVLNNQQILTREQIFDRIWGFDSDTANGIVDLYIHYLRKKMSLHNCEHLLHTVRGVGYRLKEK
ncbi:DNA-binding response regulator [Paenibacillus psychroresistens]|uniref:DNA-binding response regulator n=1 Tax=Paenibacillus psychroresistens TaxID=1778678 RepID=A0A6B8RJL7_9BACL|nr:response regulator transcription factor [Paenibacillus psychroresistens]QGQ95528.1 DNA-binding response regulator [Paenibacillus psychroresistens]